MYLSENTYLDIFSRVPPEWTWISTTTEGCSIPTPNQTGWDMGVAYFFRDPCVDLGFHNTSLAVTHQNRVCPVCIHRVRVCACAYFKCGSIWLPITWVITRPPITQDLG